MCGSKVSRGEYSACADARPHPGLIPPATALRVSLWDAKAGRDDSAQVFYDAEYFSKMLRPAFDILSVTPEAYFYQTAFLLKRKG